MKAGLHKWLDEKQLGWSPDSVEISGEDFINGFTDVLWCIDGHKRTLASRACKEFESLLGYNKPKKSKHRRKDVANLSSDVLDHHVSTLTISCCNLG